MVSAVHESDGSELVRSHRDREADEHGGYRNQQNPEHPIAAVLAHSRQERGRQPRTGCGRTSDA